MVALRNITDKVQAVLLTVEEKTCNLGRPVKIHILDVILESEDKDEQNNNKQPA